ncbi:phage head-tail connector protein [Rossellomorea vietnamensis]|uniref:Phage head-tail connector protein n=1 Tax=Rossellomorea vietnamensis TaxID=218284 RepID=A0A5D4M1M4_9BACI|nr:phage head-tail connector protein [Rossellomorea vietnamensis]TYR95719.1 phage head-tail connector protein [Rossellomorea vietnamensis]
MITVEDVKEYLPQEQDALIQKTIDRVKKHLEGYTNNPELFAVETVELDDVVLYLVLKRLNPDTKHSQGKTTESIGKVSFTFEKDLPQEIKFLLLKYQRVEIL